MSVQTLKFQSTDQDVYPVSAEVHPNEIIMTMAAASNELCGSMQAKQAAIRAVADHKLPLKNPGIEALTAPYPVTKKGEVVLQPNKKIDCYHRKFRLVQGL